MKYNINLIPAKETSLSERLVYFSLNYLRYIIVITQLVVIGVFFYRFQIDQRIIDLREAINQKKEIVQVVSPLLFQAEVINKQLMASKEIIAEQNLFTQKFNYLMSLFPSSLTLTKLEFAEEAVKMTGLSTDIRQLQSFYNLLKKEKKFETVSLESIKKEDNGYVFSLTLLKFKP